MKQVYLSNPRKDKNEFIRFQSVSAESEIKKSNILLMKSVKLFFIAVVMIPLILI